MLYAHHSGQKDVDGSMLLQFIDGWMLLRYADVVESGPLQHDGHSHEPAGAPPQRRLGLPPLPAMGE